MISDYSMKVQQARIYAEAVLGHPLDQTPEPEYAVPLVERHLRNSRELVIELLVNRDGENCYLCQTKLKAGDICIEHIIPISRGGTNEAANVALACSKCNTAKAHLWVSINTDRRPRYHRR